MVDGMLLGELSEYETERVVVRLWSRMASGLGHKWVSQFGQAKRENPKTRLMELTKTVKQWIVYLSGVPITHIDKAIDKAQRMPPDWWPTLPGFLDLCKPDYEELGIPEPGRAYMMAMRSDWSAPIVWFAMKQMGSFELRNRPEYQARPAFEKAYARLVSRAAVGEEFVIPVQDVPQITHQPIDVVEVVGGVRGCREMLRQMLPGMKQLEDSANE